MQKSISELYPPIYSEAEVPSYRLPEIGSPDLTRVQFEDHVFGRLLIDPPEMKIEFFDEENGAIEGLATRRQLKVSLHNTHGCFEFTILIYTPNSPGPAPLFLGLNFLGNHTLHGDPAVVIPASPFPSVVGAGGPPSEVDRGSWADRWPLEVVLRRGYAVATVYCGDFAPDHPDHFKEGVLRLLPKPDDETEENARGGVIAAWAWGLSRTLDAVLTLNQIDRNRVAVIGHSRLGKAALWAGANDSRFSLVISNNSGAGGAALFRRRIGERIVHLNGNFPHWFARAFHRYDEKEAELPVDQHQLLALISPRAVYVASAEDDKWADPLGEYLALAAAAPAWNEELPRNSPAVNVPLQYGPLGYHVRSGTHNILEYDWQQYLDFADRIWKKPVA